jgi:hypothetical protein
MPVILPNVIIDGPNQSTQPSAPNLLVLSFGPYANRFLAYFLNFAPYEPSIGSTAKITMQQVGTAPTGGPYPEIELIGATGATVLRSPQNNWSSTYIWVESNAVKTIPLNINHILRCRVTDTSGTLEAISRNKTFKRV